MPAGLGAKAQAKWRGLVPLIAKMVPLTETDADALRQYCECAVMREKAVAEMEDAPLLLSGTNGALYANPLLRIIKEQDTFMAKLAERFGLDPSSRKKLQVEAVKPDSAFLDFLKSARIRTKPPLAE